MPHVNAWHVNVWLLNTWQVLRELAKATSLIRLWALNSGHAVCVVTVSDPGKGWGEEEGEGGVDVVDVHPKGITAASILKRVQCGFGQSGHGRHTERGVGRGQGIEEGGMVIIDDMPRNPLVYQ